MSAKQLQAGFELHLYGPGFCYLVQAGRAARAIA